MSVFNQEIVGIRKLTLNFSVVDHSGYKPCPDILTCVLIMDIIELSKD